MTYRVDSPSPTKDGWDFVFHASTIERIIEHELDGLPHGTGKRLAAELSQVAEFLRSRVTYRAATADAVTSCCGSAVQDAPKS